MKLKIDGVILIDKPTGLTSHDVVDELRKQFQTKAIGHGGTLDPLATGLLICLVGEATKLSQYVMAEEKSYSIGIRLGIRTDSGDITGKIVEEISPDNITDDQIKETLLSLKGDLELKVPKYSAVKVKGKKLYEYARRNEEVELPTKSMSIRDVNFLGVDRADGKIHINVEIDCEKGTYVRSWVEEFGARLKCAATVSSLRRTRSGCFSLSQAHTLDSLAKEDCAGRLTHLIPLADVLGQWPALKITGRDHSLMAHGQIPNGVFSQILHFNFGSGVRVLNEDGGLLALIVKDQEKGIKLARVFQ